MANLRAPRVPLVGDEIVEPDHRNDSARDPFARFLNQGNAEELLKAMGRSI